MLRLSFMIVVLLAPLLAFSEEPLVIDVKKEQGKRFLPIDRENRQEGGAKSSAQQENDGLIIVKPKQQGFSLKSDREALTNGTLRSDWSRIAPRRKDAALVGEAETSEKKPSTAPSPEKAAATPAAKADALATLAHEESADTNELAVESDEIEGLKEGYDPVLALFEDDGQALPSSFREAMLGRREPRAAQGLDRHAVWPVALTVDQYISSGYGIRKDPFHGRPAFHGGIDIAVKQGTPVLATADGTVTAVTNDKNYGRYVAISHADGTTTRYGHLSAQQVRQGQRVRAGDPIGAVGSTGRSTGAHLDFRISRDGTKFDPLAVLSIPVSVGTEGLTRGRSSLALRRSPTVTPAPGRAAMNALPRAPMVIKVQ